MLRDKASAGEGLSGMTWLLGYNDPTDTASKGRRHGESQCLTLTLCDGVYILYDWCVLCVSRCPPMSACPASLPLVLSCLGHAMEAIAARGDLEEVTDVFYYWEGGALDGKAASYRRSATHERHTE